MKSACCLALLPLTASALVVSETTGVDLGVETGVWSAYLGRGQTICDGWMNEQGVYLSNLRIGEMSLPFYGGYWGMMHLERTPEERYSFGEWSEVDFWAGVDVGRYFHEALTFATDFIVVGLPEDHDYDAMCGVDIDVGWKCWLDPKLHLRHRILHAHAGKWEISLSCGHRWALPKDFWLSLRETCWAVDYRNVSGETPASGFTALDTRTEIGWKDLYFGLDVVAPPWIVMLFLIAADNIIALLSSPPAIATPFER